MTIATIRRFGRFPAMLNRLAPLALRLLASPLCAQSLPAPAAASAAPTAAVPHEELVKVALDTSEGRIVLALDRGRAPITTANFLRYVDSKRLDGISFYRALKLWEGTGLVQAGVRDGAKLYPPIKHEPTSVTGIHHEDGTISMARAAPGTARRLLHHRGQGAGLRRQLGPAGRRPRLCRVRSCGRGHGRRKAAARGAGVADRRREGRDAGQILVAPVKLLHARRLPD